MPARKTADVATIKAQANKALTDETARHWQHEAHGTAGARAYRMGVAAVLESILMDTGNYRGFRFADGASGKLDETLREYY